LGLDKKRLRKIYRLVKRTNRKSNPGNNKKKIPGSGIGIFDISVSTTTGFKNPDLLLFHFNAVG